jgi:branched-chain amino acid transport system ATP-binding protein
MLSLEDIHTYYGDSHILQGVTMEVTAGDVVALLGRNGVGKTTTIRSICGHTPPREGNITYDGEDITGLDPHKVARCGIGWVPAERRVFPELTVRENLQLAMRDTEQSTDSAYEHFPLLENIADSKGKYLSGGEQQMLTLARAFLGDSECLLVDEPFEGLAPQIIDDVVESIGVLKEDTTILLAEQNIEQVSRVSDRYYMMAKGEIVAETNDIEAEREVFEEHMTVS